MAMGTNRHVVRHLPVASSMNRALPRQLDKMTTADVCSAPCHDGARLGCQCSREPPKSPKVLRLFTCQLEQYGAIEQHHT
jgi:hypothetical protein